MILAVVVMSPCVSALGISGASFIDVDQGRTYTQTVLLVNSQYDFDNHFVVDIKGDIKNWVEVSPSEFDLKKGEKKEINLTLEIPPDAPLGEITGTITATGSMTAPTSSGTGEQASVGYAIATKSVIYANVVKPGALASIEITDVDAPSSIAPDSVTKITVNAKNNGNVPTSASFKLDIKKGDTLVESIRGSEVDFAIDQENTVKLFWDTTGIDKGKYEAYIEATTIASGAEKTVTATYSPVTITIGGLINNTMLAAIGAGILIVIIGFVIRRKK